MADDAARHTGAFDVLPSLPQRPDTAAAGVFVSDKAADPPSGSRGNSRAPHLRNSLSGTTAVAVEQFTRLFCKQAFEKGAEALVGDRFKRASGDDHDRTAASASSAVLYKAANGSWQRRRRQPVSSPARRRARRQPSPLPAEQDTPAAMPVTRGQAPCLGPVRGSASPFGSRGREPLAALSQPLVTGRAARRVLSDLGVRATDMLARAERDSEARAVQQGLDEFMLKHRDLLSGTRERHAVALRGTTAAAMSLAFKSRAMRLGRFRGGKYAACWRSLGAQGVRELYNSRVGGGNYTLSITAFEAMHEQFSQQTPEVWAAILEDDPVIITKFFNLVDVNGDNKVSFPEFIAAVALITMSSRAQRNLSVIFDTLDGVPPSGRLFVSHFSVELLYSTVLPRVSEEEDRSWRRALLAIHTIGEQYLKPQESWGYDQYLEHLFLHYRRPLDDEFGHR
eukprot:TRINITY_DN4214_c0_g1_i2.p1 TRINITY_DN4214_c0_g1~~TRINITY_DN4214_c0_g1_i2.p1  ORF type:complete len:452 (+),score=71.33 TRINITY_DN4214_c0_g1_i2:85-1440(+)